MWQGLVSWALYISCTIHSSWVQSSSAGNICMTIFIWNPYNVATFALTHNMDEFPIFLEWMAPGKLDFSRLIVWLLLLVVTLTVASMVDCCFLFCSSFLSHWNELPPHVHFFFSSLTVVVVVIAVNILASPVHCCFCSFFFPSCLCNWCLPAACCLHNFSAQVDSPLLLLTSSGLHGCTTPAKLHFCSFYFYLHILNKAPLSGWRCCHTLEEPACIYCSCCCCGHMVGCCTHWCCGCIADCYAHVGSFAVLVDCPSCYDWLLLVVVAVICFACVAATVIVNVDCMTSLWLQLLLFLPSFPNSCRWIAFLVFSDWLLNFCCFLVTLTEASKLGVLFFIWCYTSHHCIKANPCTDWFKFNASLFFTIWNGPKQWDAWHHPAYTGKSPSFFWGPWSIFCTKARCGTIVWGQAEVFLCFLR